MKKVFFIGYNRTATKSLTAIFQHAGYKAWHYTFPVQHTTGRIIGKPIALQMHENLANKEPILSHMPEVHVYSDIVYQRSEVYIDAIKYYRQMYLEYPDAYFVLNTRNVDGWVQSKVNHKNGEHLQRCMAYHGFDDEVAMIDKWVEDRAIHHENVKAFFADKKYANFLEWHLENDSITKLIQFVKKDFTLSEKDWHQLI